MSTLLEELNQLAPLAAAATPGIWHITPAYPYNDGQVLSYLPERRNTSIVANCRTTNYYEAESTANAAFIAATRKFLTPERIAHLSAALSATPVVGGGGPIDFLLAIELLRNSAEAMRNQGQPISAYAYQIAADALASPAPLVAAGAGQGFVREDAAQLLAIVYDIENNPDWDAERLESTTRMLREYITATAGLLPSNPLQCRDAAPQPEATPRHA